MITSLQNSRVKGAIRLRNARYRQRQKRIIIDGVRELARAISAGVRMVEIFVCEPLLRGEESQSLLIALETCGGEILPVSEAVFNKLSFGDRAEGILGVAEMPQRTLIDISLPSPLPPLPKGEGKIDERPLPKGEGTNNEHSLPKGEGPIMIAAEKNPLVAVLEGVEKPGNIGAVLRSADAAGVSALIVADCRTDLYNPNTIRASLGTIFTVPVCEAPSGDVLAWLRENKISIIAARVDGTMPYTEVDYRGPTAIVLGSESSGLTSIWNSPDITAIRLPMLGAADSLNVSAAAAVIFYEALRQRDS
jgi:TrmH family RNA methyltransferase